jgi:hypothetical protein
MAGDKRILVADAADFIGTPDAPRVIELAWKLRKQFGFRFFGVRAGESEPIEIPFNEDGKIDCEASRIGEGALFATYRSVTIVWEDCKRLAQADVQRLLAQEAEAPSGAKTLARPGATAGKRASR